MGVSFERYEDKMKACSMQPYQIVEDSQSAGNGIEPKMCAVSVQFDEKKKVLRLETIS